MIDPKSIPSPYVYPLLGLLLTASTVGLTFLGKWLVKLVLNANHAFTNCLPTIQKNTEQTNKILTEYVAYMKGRHDAKVEDGVGSDPK
jgi:hypothetical protein